MCNVTRKEREFLEKAHIDVEEDDAEENIDIDAAGNKNKESESGVSSHYKDLYEQRFQSPPETHNKTRYSDSFLGMKENPDHWNYDHYPHGTVFQETGSVSDTGKLRPEHGRLCRF
nr:uncharacterized protein LOC117690899 [Crassostrea gigas]